jgi:hypothetical protein
MILRFTIDHLHASRVAGTWLLARRLPSRHRRFARCPLCATSGRSTIGGLFADIDLRAQSFRAESSSVGSRLHFVRWFIGGPMPTHKGLGTDDLVIFNLAIDSKLRASDLVKLRIDDICSVAKMRHRATIVQKKIGRPVQVRDHGAVEEFPLPFQIHFVLPVSFKRSRSISIG